MKRLTHGSTFSGIGGPEVAAAMLGIENVFSCEINEFGSQVLKFWFPNAEHYDDITTTDFKKWRGKIDILTGGFPCQPFSYAGKRRGAEDDRYLWPQMLRCIQEIRPSWFVGENVGGIATMVLPGSTTKMGGQADIFGEGDDIERTAQTYVLEEICRELEGCGYSVQPLIIPACAVGAPHRRDRIFIIAHNERDDERVTGVGNNAGDARLEEQRPEQPTERTAGDGKIHAGATPQAESPRPSSQATSSLAPNDGTSAPGPSERFKAARRFRLSEPSRRGREAKRTNRLLKFSRPTLDASSRRRPLLELLKGIHREVRGQEQAKNALDGARENLLSRHSSQRADSNNNNNAQGPIRDRSRGEMRRGTPGQPREVRGEGNASDNSEARGTTSDADCFGLQERQQSRFQEDSEEARARMDHPTQRPSDDGTAPGTRWADDPSLLPHNRWRNFPTQSPICGRNDGLPLGVDALSISEAKWRKASLMAYGNAIVPQVIFSIFEAIKKIELNEIN